MSVVSAFPNGGDIETFANAFSRGDIIDTTERIVGMFDGKPMYQKLINFGALPNSSAKEVAHNITNIDKIVYIDGFCYSRSNPLNSASLNYSANTTANLKYCTSLSTETNNKIRIETTSDFSTWDAYVLLRYTKTTDTANTVKYGTGNDYSADETIVGTWIANSKLVYQKTWEILLPQAVPDGTETFVQLLTVSDLGIYPIAYEAVVDKDDIAFIVSGFANGTRFLNVGTNSNKVFLHSNIGLSTTDKVFLTMRYVK